MSWTGDYWGKNGAVALAKQRFESSQKESTDYVAYASVCYSAANRVFADVLHLRWDGIKRFAVGVKLARLSVYLIDQIILADLKIFSDIRTVEYADALDIGCSVYARYGWMYGGRRKVLGRWIKNAKDLIDACKAKDCYIFPHTKAFLILHKIRFDGQGLKSFSTLYPELEDLARKSVQFGELAQATRVYRQLSAVLLDKYQKRYYLAVAKELAEKAGATDQLAKL